MFFSKRERLLLLTMIKERDARIEQERSHYMKLIDDLKEDLVRERLRAEAAINLVLAKTVKAVLTPDIPLSDKEIEKREDQMFGIHGTENEGQMTLEHEKQILADLQTIRIT